MEQTWIVGRLLFEELDSSITNPSPYFSGDENSEHDDKPSSNFVSEDGHSQACFSDGEPSSFCKLFDFDRS